MGEVNKAFFDELADRARLMQTVDPKKRDMWARMEAKAKRKAAELAKAAQGARA